MIGVTIALSLDEQRSDFAPGENLAGEFRIAGAEAGELQAIEISILWSTEGKGDEDMAVHYFERITLDESTAEELCRSRRFAAKLPLSPLSYDGVILKLRWCVRVRAFLARGKQLVEERPFRLGNIPPARAILP